MLQVEKFLADAATGQGTQGSRVTFTEVSPETTRSMPF